MMDVSYGDNGSGDGLLIMIMIDDGIGGVSGQY